jgi:hypothetical protein
MIRWRRRDARGHAVGPLASGGGVGLRSRRLQPCGRGVGDRRFPRREPLPDRGPSGRCHAARCRRRGRGTTGGVSARMQRQQPMHPGHLQRRGLRIQGGARHDHLSPGPRALRCRRDVPGRWSHLPHGSVHGGRGPVQRRRSLQRRRDVQRSRRLLAGRALVMQRRQSMHDRFLRDGCRVPRRACRRQYDVSHGRLYCRPVRGLGLRGRHA